MTTAFPLRMLTDDGIRAFRVYLQGLRQGSRMAPPREMLLSPHQSEEFPIPVAVEQRTFASRIEFCRYMTEVIGKIPYNLIDGDIHLWSWLSLFYFDQVCPVRTDETRRPGMDYRHIPFRDYRYRHRHLMEGAYHVYHLYGDEAALLLCSPLYQENAFHHELAGRQVMIANPAIISVATELYYDVEKERPKTGSGQWSNPGTLRRFIDVVNQLDMTHDLFTMTPRRLMELLPPEFDAWKQGSLSFSVFPTEGRR
ncbi:MAG TPA: hypothetical protein VK445_08795 [Dissulfurispiraceae bacterium]|nr:hypothetical protein [Dissulfurispiraceae bacterium]